MDDRDFPDETIPEAKPTEGERPVVSNPQDTALSAFQREVYQFHQGVTDGQPGEVARTADRVQLRQGAIDSKQKITADLENAKKSMIQLNEITKAGGGPYDDATKQAYATALRTGETAYIAARNKSDVLLYEVERVGGRPDGAPILENGLVKVKTDADGKPIESAVCKDLRKERDQLTQEIKALGNPTADPGKADLAKKLQDRADINDVLRMSGYARANHGLGLLFACPQFRNNDRADVRVAAESLIQDANIFDPLTRKDANFQAHYIRAVRALDGVAPAVRPGDPVDVRPPGDKPPVVKPPEAIVLKDIPGVPGAKFDEVNKRIIDGPYSLASGDKVLQPSKDNQNRVLAVDGKPVLDDKNNPRLGSDGLPIPVALAGDDPRVKLAQAETAAATGALTADHLTAYRGAITAADGLDRVSLARRIADNRTRVEALPHALAFIELDNLRNLMGQLSAGATDPQKTALGKMWNEVTQPKATGAATWAAMDTWLAKTENAAAKTALEAHPKWAQIKAVFEVFVAKNSEANKFEQLKETDFTKNPQLLKDINEARQKMGENVQLAQLYLSPMTARITFLEKLCDQPDVKQFMALSAADKATNALKDNVQVKAAVEMMQQLAQCNRDLVDNSKQQGQVFLQRAAALGITKFETPARTTGTPDRPVETPVRVEVPPTAKPPETAQITKEQDGALQAAMVARASLVQQTENGTKKLDDAKFAPIDAAFKKALSDAQSVKTETLTALSADLNEQYRKELGKIKNTPAITLAQAEIDRKASADALKITGENLDRALKNLPADKKTAYDTLQTKYDADIKAKETELVGKRDAEMVGKQDAEKPAIAKKYLDEFNAENGRLSVKLLEDKKALSTELKVALEAQVAMLNKPETRLLLQYSEINEGIDKLKLAPDMIKMYYAQALTIQGDMVNAKKYFEEAIKNPTMATIIDNTQEGLALAEKLGVKTPGLAAVEKEADRLFPELKKVGDALKLIDDAKAKSPEEQKTAFAAACKLFDDAVGMTDREGADARKAEELRASANAIKLQLELAEKDIVAGKRTDFTQGEKEQFQKMQLMNKQLENISLVRYKYALVLNEHGYTHNDDAAKAKAIEMLKSIKTVDEQTFLGSPEVQGALKQAEEGKKINPETAAAEAFVTAATTTISAHGTGLIDWVLPGGSAGANLLVDQVAPGRFASEAPFIGPVLFGGGKEAKDKAVAQLAQAYLTNPDATQAVVNQQVSTGLGGLREIGSDALAVGVGLGTKYGAGKVLGRFGTPGKIGAFALGMASAGLTKDLAADGELGTTKDWLRGGGMYGASWLVMKGMALNPSRATLAEGTLTGVSTRMAGIELKAGANAAGMTADLWAARAALQKEVAGAATAELKAAAAQKLVLLDAQLGGWTSRLGQRLNPLNYMGLQFNGGLLPRYVGFGGERTAAALADGSMSFAQYNARRGAGSFFATGGSAFLFGGAREGLYIGTGKTRADGTPHTLNSAIKDMGGAGLQTTLAATLMLPMAGGLARSVGLGRPLDYVGKVATNRLTALGATELGVVAVGDLALITASPALKGVEDYSNARQLKVASEEAKKVAAEAREKARKELEARKQQQAKGQRPGS